MRTEIAKPSRGGSSVTRQRGSISAVRRAVPDLHWRLVSSQAEYEAVVRLRTTAYARAGKIDQEQNAAMRDAFDVHAKILAGWHGSRPVASLRIMLHDEGATWEHGRYVDLEHPTLPALSATAEITRVCVDRDWAGTDVSLELFRHAALEVLRSGRRYILGCATRAALRLYTRIGCETTGLTFRFAELGGDVHHIFFADLVARLGGHGLPWKVWSTIWSDAHAVALAEGLLPRPSLVHAARLASWKIRRSLLLRRARRAQQEKERHR